MTLAAGQVIEVQNYPFVRTSFSRPNWDEAGCSEDVIEGWKPGCDFEEADEFSGASFYADETGTMILTVVSLHKPGRYPTRVFFTRQWRDPDGKVFGAQKLRVTTEQAFKRMAKGYRHEFETVGIDEVTE